MKTFITTFGTSQYINSISKLKESAKSKSDYFVAYNEGDIGTAFYKKNEEIFRYPRGYGFWVWKPYIILKTMAEMEYGDILLYTDAGNTIIDDLTPIFNLCAKNDGIYLFDNRNMHPQKQPWYNSPWVKGDCFLMMGCNLAVYHSGKHVDAAFQVYQKTRPVIDFLEEYQHYCQNINIISDLPNIQGVNQPDFYDHRHDQSVLSLLAIKYKVAIGREPSQFGAEGINENSSYGTLFNHHRNR